jgi:hypothetical protein
MFRRSSHHLVGALLAAPSMVIAARALPNNISDERSKQRPYE